MSNDIKPGRVIDAFTHGAGYTPNTLAITLGSIAFVGLLAWVIWTGWSGFKGMRNNKVTKEVFRRLIFRALFIFLILQFFLFYGIAA
uniref:Integrating conjugative element protein n=1 Tax=Aliivibrio fischeri TaxID=668 RepID=H2ES39_ALIFS|nr:TIGR03758 family integrating conjugative element protein [Aliivibrio fischeri]AEY78206.1 hypothetical protein [Aliivibrio fischeri]